MKNVVKCWVAGTLLLAGTAQYSGAADAIVIAGKTTTGKFQGFENGRFLFEPDKGKNMREMSSRVTRLTLDPARSVTVIYKANKMKEPVNCGGFEKTKFVLDENGKDISELPSRIDKIIILGEAGQEGEGEGDGFLRIDLQNLSDWMKESNPAPAQTKAFDRYKTARGIYDGFLAKSAEMVKEMDKTKGPAREALLNKLRLRKNEEQPILNEMKQAQAELLAAFPELKKEPGKK